MKVQVNSTDVTLYLHLIQTDGTPLTGQVFSDVSLSYVRERETPVAITEQTLATLNAAHADGGFLEVGLGLYRFDPPDPAFVFGPRSVRFYGSVAGGLVVPYDVELSHDSLIRHIGLAQAATAGTVTLALTAPTAENVFRGKTAAVLAGTGAMQSQPIAAYSTGRVATLLNNWLVTPDATSLIAIIDTPDMSAIVNAAVAQINTNTNNQVGTLPTATNIETLLTDENDARILPRLPAIAVLRGEVVDAVGNSASTFDTDLPGGADRYNRLWLRFTSGANQDQALPISDFDGAGVVTIEGSFSAEPTAGDTFDIVNH